MKSLIVFQIIIFVFVTALAQNDNQSISDRIAPNFKLENIDSEVIELNDLIGAGPILLCFWSSCCKSAVMQIEAFAGLYDKYKTNGLVMLAISTDDEKTVAKVKPFVKSKNFNFEVLYDTDGAVARIYYAFDIPFSVLISKSRNITYSHLGYMKGDEIELEKNLINIYELY